jgi:hypothetical protein
MERQLLEIFGFDLRFTEEEALHHFAPFLKPVQSPKETRAAAVERVQRGSRARCQAPPPPISPMSTASSRSSSPDSSMSASGSITPAQSACSPQSTMSITLASPLQKTESSAPQPYLKVPGVDSRTRLRSSTVPSLLNLSLKSVGSTTSSTGESEMGSLTEDNGSSSSESELESPTKSHSFRKFAIRPASTYGYNANGGRKRGATAQPDLRLATSSTESIDLTSQGSQDKSVSRRAFDFASAARLSAYGSEGKDALTKAPSTSFLARMWGKVASSSTDTQASKMSLPVPEVCIVDPESSPERINERTHPLGPRYAPGSLRRLVHSRSAVFRANSFNL